VIVLWLPGAQLTRMAQIDFIARDNPAAALTQDQRLEAQVDRLVRHPELGRTGRIKGTRELVVSRTPFVVIYRVRSELKRVEILRVLHVAQHWPRQA